MINPYFEGKGITLYHGDALVILQQLQSDSIDAVITDPPYGINFQSTRRPATERFDKIANDKRPFIWWLYDAYRITKLGGALACFHRWNVQEDFKRAIYLAGYDIRSQIIWDREHHGLGDVRRMFAPQHDSIWFATKGDFRFPNGRPKSVLRERRLSGSALTHPNEKPVGLLVQLCDSITRSGDLILDPFAGSGSTLAAAALRGRKAIGIELDERYCEHIAARIEQLQVELTQDARHAAEWEGPDGSSPVRVI